MSDTEPNISQQPLPQVIDETKEKVGLPIFEGSPLPTQKWHISYSEMVDWVDCSERHNLKHIKKIDLDKPNEHTQYGGIVHDAIEQYILGNAPLDAEATGKKIIEELSKIEGFKGKPEEWAAAVGPVFQELPGFLAENFQNFKPVAAELELMESLERKKNRYFKGFIDFILECEKVDKRRKEPVVEKQYWIIDWKNTDWGWTGDKKRDPLKQMQLVLYKHFWCTKNNIPLDQVKCGWVLLKRTAKPGQHIELVPVSAGEKTIEKALETVYRMIGSVERKFFVKNRNSCKYCPYYMTEHCK